MPPLRQNRLTLVLLIAAICLPALLVYAILYREAISIPITDDYNAIIAFALNWSALPSTNEKLLYILAAQHNNYKLIFEHILITLQLSLFHHLNFSFLIFLGNLTPLPVLYIFWKTYFADEPDLRTRLLLFLPIPYLLLQLNYVENLDWAMASLQNLAIFTFTLPAIYCLAKPARSDFALACIWTVLACATSANGFLLAPVGFLMLLTQRNFSRIAAWVILFIPLLAVYFYKYTREAVGPSHSLLTKPLFFLSFAGSAVENMHGRPIKHLAILLGLTLCLVFLHAAIKRYDRTNPVAFYSALWTILTAILVTTVRATHGVPLSLSSRYKIYCDLLLIFCYGYIVHSLRIRRNPTPHLKRLFACTAVGIILFSISTDIIGYRFLEKRRQLVILGMRQYVADPAVNSPMILSLDDYSPEAIKQLEDSARSQLTRAIQSGIYTPPPIDPLPPQQP